MSKPPEIHFQEAGGTVESFRPNPAPDLTHSSKVGHAAIANHGKKTGVNNRSLPSIRVIDAELPRVVDEVEFALLQANLGLYQRGGRIVRPICMKVPAGDGRTTISWRLGIVSGAHIAETATRAASFSKYDRRKKEWHKVGCPTRIAETYLARMEWRLPPLAGTITAPLLRFDGSLLDQPGYDPGTALLFDPADTIFPPVPDHPTRKEAEDALELYVDLLSEFPFVDEIDRAVALSGILTALVRRSLPSAPIHVITAPDFGYGKTLLADIIAFISTGNFCPVSSQGDSPEELGKHLAAALIDGADLICIDNISQPLGGDLLCQMLTQRTVRLRPLGISTTMEVSTAITVLATGTNLVIQDDLVRRALRCRLAGNLERPELRQFKKRPLEEIAANRGALVAAGLTILRGYIATGRLARHPTVGSFEAWCSMVRDPLCWLGLPDVTDSITKTRAGDTKLSSLGALLEQWNSSVGSTGITAKSLVAKACEQEPDGREGTDRFIYPELRDALLTIAGDKGAISTVTLGYWLRSNAGKIVDGRRIIQDSEGHHVQKWRCENLWEQEE
jgi:hypothetical protein